VAARRRGHPGGARSAPLLPHHRPRVVRAVEALAEIAPSVPVLSLREGTRAHALRRSRLCYDHLGGQLGRVRPKIVRSRATPPPTR
jgi:hypothetical protein